MKENMTTGKPYIIIFKFALPLLLGSVIQNLYNIFDTAIVGHAIGKYALAAVGNSYVPMLIINSIILGISSGITIFVSQALGSKEDQQIKKCVGTVQTLILSVGCGIAFMLGLGARRFFVAMEIPEEIFSDTVTYLQIIAMGVPFLAIYNFYSAILKGKGNSKLPTLAICFSCVLNIVLDYLFVVSFGFGIKGAAIATIASQALAAGIVTKEIWRHDLLKIPFGTEKINMILRLSITGIFQNGASALSMFFIQRMINQYGVNEISAYMAACKIESFLTMPAISLGGAVCVFVAQNIGAKDFERVRQGLKDSIKLSVGYVAIVITVLWCAAPFLLQLLVGNEPEVINIGVIYLRIISITFPLCVSLYLMTNFLRGAGEIFYPLFNTILELSVRTIAAFVLSFYLGFVGVFLCRPFSFIVSTMSLSLRYRSGKWKKGRSEA